MRVLVVGVLLWPFGRRRPGWPCRPSTPGRRRPRARLPARHAVLIMNPWSGGGKVERFELERLCRERGIEPIVLYKGSDLLALAEDAVAARGGRHRHGRR